MNCHLHVPAILFQKRVIPVSTGQDAVNLDVTKPLSLSLYWTIPVFNDKYSRSRGELVLMSCDSPLFLSWQPKHLFVKYANGKKGREWLSVKERLRNCNQMNRAAWGTDWKLMNVDCICRLERLWLCEFQNKTYRQCMDEILNQRFSTGVTRHTGLTREVCRSAQRNFGGRSKRRTRENWEIKIVEVSFGSTVYCSKETDKNKNKNHLIKSIVVKFHELSSPIFQIPKWLSNAF